MMFCLNTKIYPKACRFFLPGFGKKGMAMLELLPVIWMMFIFLGASLGSWGIVHTATLHSIAARNYAFFTFNNNSDLSYLNVFRDSNKIINNSSPVYYRSDARGGGTGIHGKRFHFIATKDKATITRLPAFGKDLSDYSSEPDLLQASDRNSTTWWGVIDPRNYLGSGGKKAAPAWIMVGCGICLDARCGD